MVKAKEVKLVMSPCEDAIGLKKRWIARYRLVQQIDCRQRVRAPAKAQPNDIIGARIELESDEISGWLLPIASLSADVTLAFSRSATFCAISLWIENKSSKSRSYCSAQTCVSERVSINCALRRRCVPALRTLPSTTCHTRRQFPI